MKYRLNPLISVSQRLTLQRWANPQKTKIKAEFVKLEPGYYYDKYADDDLYLKSLRNWEVVLRSSDKLINALKEMDIPYRMKKGCSCSGGHMNVIFKGIEVVE